jgi:hypothetical protein
MSCSVNQRWSVYIHELSVGSFVPKRNPLFGNVYQHHAHVCSGSQQAAQAGRRLHGQNPTNKAQIERIEELLKVRVALQTYYTCTTALMALQAAPGCQLGGPVCTGRMPY